MRRMLVLLFAFLVSLAPFAASASADRASEAEAEAMVKKAIQYYDKNGKEKALAEYMRKPGPFVDRDLYVTVYDMQGNDLAHINPRMVGKNMMDLRDAKGKYHIRERMEAARTHTSGWQDFEFYNPVSKRIEPKRMYWEKHDNLVFACGAYKAQ